MTTKHAPTKITLTRKSLARLATVEPHADPDPEQPDFDDGCPDSDDAGTLRWIRAERAAGNVWAWCVATVTAEYDGLVGRAVLGGCSYASRKDFEASNLADLTTEALDDLWRQLEERTPAGRAKALAAGSRQAITTSYRGPTDTSRSRVIARCEAKRISVPWDHALDPGANHAAAALQLMDQLGWSENNDLVMGGTRDGYVFVQVQVPKGGK
jgi:hypothetical protein